MNFNTADRQTWNAIHRLNGQEMQPFLQFLNKQLDYTKTSLISAEGVTLHRLQGKAGFLEDLLNAAGTAHSVLEKLR